MMEIEKLMSQLLSCNKNEIKQYLEGDIRPYYSNGKLLLKYFKKRGGKIVIINNESETSHFTVEFNREGFHPVIYFNLSDVYKIKNSIENDTTTINDTEKQKGVVWYTLYIVLHELTHVPIWVLTNKYRKEFYNAFVKDIEYIYTNMGKYFSYKTLKNKSQAYKIWKGTKYVILDKLIDLNIDDEKDPLFMDFWEIIEDGVMGGIIYMLRKRILENRTEYDIYILNYIHRLMNNKHDLDYYTDWFIIVNEILTDMLIYMTSVEYRLMYEHVLPNLYVTLYIKIHNDDSFKELRKLL